MAMLPTRSALYNLALVARAHGIPFYVCAPGSSIDRSTADGDAITIEERDAEEITHARGVAIAAPGAQTWNPAFDITPAHLVTGFITEFGVLRPPYREVLSASAAQSALTGWAPVGASARQLLP